MGMDYEKYYESVNEQNDNPQKKRGGFRRVLGFIGLALVFIIVGMLLAGIVQSMRNPWLRYEFSLPGLPESMPSWPVRSEATPTPAPTPKPTPANRPMIEYDGVAPVLPAQGNPIPDMIDGIAPGVVGVLNYADDPDNEAETKEDLLQGMGTGFVISSLGYIVTNAHVIQDAHEIAVEFIDGAEVTAVLIGMDTTSDVAVLKVDYPNIKPLKLGSSDAIRVGDYAIAVGNPLGRGLEGTVTLGIISARSRAVPIDGKWNMYIQTDAAINLGNSGGPLLNMKGEVIGMNTAKTVSAGVDEYGMLISAEGLGFALPINNVQLIMERLITVGFVQRAALGVNILALNRAQLDELGLKNGIEVHEVAQGSPAHNANIQPGDIILACDGISFLEQTELVEYISMRPIGTTISMDIWRDGEIITLSVELTDKDQVAYDDMYGLPEEE